MSVLVHCNMRHSDRCPLKDKCPHYVAHEPYDECDTPSRCEDKDDEWFDIQCAKLTVV